MNESIIAYFGGDTKGLRRATEEAGTVVKGFSREAKGFLGDVSKGLVGAAIFGEFIKLGKEAVAEAQKLRDEADRLGEPLATTTRSLANLGDGFKGVFQGAKNLVGFIISGWAMVAEGIDQAALSLAGFNIASGEELERFRQIERQTTQTLAAIAKAREANSPDKIAAAEAKLAEQRRKNAMEEKNAGERYIAIMQERIQLEEKVAANGSLHTVEAIALQTELAKKIGEEAEAKKKAIKENAEAQEAYQKEAQKVFEIVEETGTASGKWKTLTEQRTVAEQTNAKILKEETLPTEKDITAELEAQAKAAKAKSDAAQKDFEARQGLLTGGGAAAADEFNKASDATLAEIVRRNRNEAERLARGPQNIFTGKSDAYYAAANTANLAQKEIDARADFRRNASIGADYARRQYSGTLNFEQLFSQLVGKDGSLGMTEKTQQSIQNIDSTLTNVFKK